MDDRGGLGNFRIILILAGFSLIALAAILLSSRMTSISINEIMLDNDSFYSGHDGAFPDWIELHNATGKAIDLSGMYLSDDQRNLKKWRIENQLVEAWDYLVLESSDDPMSGFPFGISPNDRNIILSGRDGRIIQSVSLRKIGKDNSLAWDGIRWIESADPSPGYANTDEGYAKYFDSISAKEYTLRINEYCPVNRSGAADENGERPDWIEIHNYGDSDIDLAGIGLSDSAGKRSRWRFPSAVMSAGEYLLVFASGRDIKKSSKWFHTDFRLNDQRDSIILSSPQGMVIDRVDIGDFPLEAESAGIVDGNMLLFMSSSPGSANGEGLKPCPYSVAHSHKSGFYGEGLSLELSAKGGTIRCTVDGSEPGPRSPLYRKALSIGKSTVVRARVFADGCVPGRISTATYFINEESSLPVLSISLAPELLYSEDKGLLVFGRQHSARYPYMGANFWQEWEYPVGVEMFAEDGTQVFSSAAGIKIFGSFSRGLPQKSFVLNFRGIYGMPRLPLRLFPEKEIYSFESFVLRSGGQDSQDAKIRDLAAGKLAALLGLEYQAGYPVLMFLNGEYYGVCNLREKINASFLAANSGRPDKRGFDLLEGNGIVLSGSFARYRELTRFAEENDLSIAENYARICQWVDIENFIDYHLLQVYVGNLDSGNTRFWRGKASGDKWRWIVYDVDYSFGDPQVNALEHWLDPEGRGYEKQVSTQLITQLLRNEEFKDLFIRRFVFHLQRTLSPEAVSGIIRKQADLVAPEMPRQIGKWGLRTDTSWEKMIENMVLFAERRNAIVLDDLKGRFGLSEAQFRKYLEP